MLLWNRKDSRQEKDKSYRYSMDSTEMTSTILWRIVVLQIKREANPQIILVP